jgi:hypothetical protein
MKFLNQLIPWLSSVLIFILTEQLLKTPHQASFLVPLAIVVIILSIWQLTGRNFFSRKFWQNIITPTLFLVNISTHLDLITVFFVASSLFSLLVFLGISSWFIIIIFAVIMLILSSQISWVSEANLSEVLPFLLVISLGVTEIFWAVSFLPTSVYVGGLIVALSYYLMSGISRNWLLGIKEGKVVKRYLLISSIILVIVLLTAKWF